MREKDFTGIQAALRRALNEPPAPAGLVERTRRRCEAAAAGLAAESRLRQDDALRTEEIYDLAAAGVMGRLAVAKHLPEGQSLPEMHRRLAGSQWLRERTGATAAETLRALREGSFLHGGGEPPREARRETPPQKNGPARQV